MKAIELLISGGSVKEVAYSVGYLHGAVGRATGRVRSPARTGAYSDYQGLIPLAA